MSSPSLMLVLLAFSSSARRNNSSTFFNNRALTSDFFGHCFFKSPLSHQAKLGVEGSGQKVLLIFKGAGEPLVYGVKEGIDQRVAELEIGIDLQVNQLFFGHNEGGDQAAQIALFLSLDLIQCKCDLCHDLIIEKEILFN